MPFVAAGAVGALACTFLPSRWPVLLIVLPVAVAGAWLAAVDLDVHPLLVLVALDRVSLVHDLAGRGVHPETIHQLQAGASRWLRLGSHLGRGDVATECLLPLG